MQKILDAAEEEVVTQSDNVLLQEVTAGASGYVEDTGVTESESESDIMKQLRFLLKTPQKRSISITAICRSILTETRNRSQQSNVQ